MTLALTRATTAEMKPTCTLLGWTATRLPPEVVTVAGGLPLVPGTSLPEAVMEAVAVVAEVVVEEMVTPQQEAVLLLVPVLLLAEALATRMPGGGTGIAFEVTSGVVGKVSVTDEALLVSLDGTTTKLFPSVGTVSR